MAVIDFPAGPIVGQIHTTANGLTYTWDGDSWLNGTGSSYTRTEEDARFVNYDGDTMTGTLIAPTFQVTTNFYMTLQSSNPLLNFDVNDYYAYDRTNNLHNFAINSVVLLTLASAVATFTTVVVLPATVPTLATHAANKQYVDDKSGTLPQNSQSANYTAALTDVGKHIFHPSADTTARTFTIPANATVAFPIGTRLYFVNQNAAGVITIAITSDVMRLAGAGTTGNRTLAANGIAKALKLTATEWIIEGPGLT